MNKWFELILGLILLVGTIALIFPGMPLESWGSAALTVLKGGLAWVVAIIGLILIILGISEIKG
jgi:type IV secretory pathway VirB2 component (pilin)